MIVLLTPDAQRQAHELPLAMRARLQDVITRLERWPDVSGCKPMTHDWKGHYRVRMGDWRVIFQVVAPSVIVVRIAHRSKVYE
jgi:mRNA-degrading endonuclease RelE of RelBE toxin-antitoxin system